MRMTKKSLLDDFNLFADFGGLECAYSCLFSSGLLFPTSLSGDSSKFTFSNKIFNGGSSLLVRCVLENGVQFAKHTPSSVGEGEKTSLEVVRFSEVRRYISDFILSSNDPNLKYELLSDIVFMYDEGSFVFNNALRSWDMNIHSYKGSIGTLLCPWVLLTLMETTQTSFLIDGIDYGFYSGFDMNGKKLTFLVNDYETGELSSKHLSPGMLLELVVSGQLSMTKAKIDVMSDVNSKILMDYMEGVCSINSNYTLEGAFLGRVKKPFDFQLEEMIKDKLSCPSVLDEPGVVEKLKSVNMEESIDSGVGSLEVSYAGSYSDFLDEFIRERVSLIKYNDKMIDNLRKAVHMFHGRTLELFPLTHNYELMKLGGFEWLFKIFKEAVLSLNSVVEAEALVGAGEEIDLGAEVLPALSNSNKREELFRFMISRGLVDYLTVSKGVFVSLKCNALIGDMILREVGVSSISDLSVTFKWLSLSDEVVEHTWMIEDLYEKYESGEFSINKLDSYSGQKIYVIEMK